MDIPEGLGDVIASLMSNPEIMSTVSSLAAKAAEEKPSDNAPPKGPEAQSGQTPLQKAPSPNKRKELMNALKPYLSPRRRAVIDSLLQFEGLAHVLGIFNSDNKS